MTKDEKTFYSTDQVQALLTAYRDLFPVITPELRAYWDLDRIRPWCSLPSDFHRANFSNYESLTKRALEIERTIFDPVKRGEALQQASVDAGVGLCIGLNPYADAALHQTYEANRHKGRITVMVMHDWYPIVPLPRGKKFHPVDAPLRRQGGILEVGKYERKGAFPLAVREGRELMLFLNFKPDYRPPGNYSSGHFAKSYDRLEEGFMATLESLCDRFPCVNLISYGVPSWEALSGRVPEMSAPLGILAHAKSNEWMGKVMDLPVGRSVVRYLPLAHPDRRINFCPEHSRHAHLGFEAMGLDGASLRAW
ncbi:hypothetical protein ACG02S_09230 [Roseateles sp. DC23W]|uniref:Uncharacterized protein n=1 Tax=Pelomonas dachongensis TaxID=3299029 RepID=A0ABW7ELL5_9BURK